MRVTTAFNRMLMLPGASVQDVAFGGEGVIVTVRLRRRRRACSGCGAAGLEIKDRRTKRWRHLDLGSSRCVIECELGRLRCPGCGDRPEMVPWARAGSPYTRDLEDVVAFLDQRMAKTPLARLVRIGWRSVGKILARVVADELDRGRLDGLVMIGVDEVSHGAGTGSSPDRHRRGQSTVGELAAAEPLLTLPQLGFPAEHQAERVVAGDALVAFESNRYSVPPGYAAQTVTATGAACL